MTLKDVREPARLITDWCLTRDDLLGFHVELKEPPSMAWLQVYLYWPNGWVNSRAFDLLELRLLRDPRAVVDAMERMADEACRRELPVAD